jgi:hypothetical protein
VAWARPSVLGHPGLELVLSVLKTSRIPYRTAMVPGVPVRAGTARQLVFSIGQG